MSPVIEKLNSKGYEVLFACEPLDEIMMESLREFKEKNIVDAAKENLQLDEDDEDAKKKREALTEEYKNLAEYLETLFTDKVQKVVVSDHLVDSPAALVQGAYGMSPTMQRYMRAQAVASGANADAMGGMNNKAVLEINPNHPIVQDLDRMAKDDRGSDKLKETSMLMYDVAAMTSGYDVGDLRSFAKRVMGLMNEQVAESNRGDDDSSGDDEEAKEAEVVA